MLKILFAVLFVKSTAIAPFNLLESQMGGPVQVSKLGELVEEGFVEAVREFLEEQGVGQIPLPEREEIVQSAIAGEYEEILTNLLPEDC
jgi:hypothetical protein